MNRREHSEQHRTCLLSSIRHKFKNLKRLIIKIFIELIINSSMILVLTRVFASNFTQVCHAFGYEKPKTF